jgi:hypothetical protein
VILKDELARWKLDPVTQAVTDELHERLDWLITNMASGGFFDPENMPCTFSSTAKALGEIEGLNIFFRVIEGMTDPKEEQDD